MIYAIICAALFALASTVFAWAACILAGRADARAEQDQRQLQARTEGAGSGFQYHDRSNAA